MSRQTGLAAQIHTQARNIHAAAKFVAVVDHVVGVRAAIIRPGQATVDHDETGQAVLYPTINTVTAGDRALVFEAGGTWIVLGTLQSPALTTIVQIIDWDDIPPTALHPDTTIITSPTVATQLGSAIVIVAMATTNPATWTASDDAGHVYTLIASSPKFGRVGSHPVAGAGEYYLGIFVALNCSVIPNDGSIIMRVHFGDIYGLAMVWYEVAGLDRTTSADGAPAATVISDGGGANSLSTIDSGLTGVTTLPTDLIVGVVLGVWDDAGYDGNVPPTPYTFTPTPGENWDLTWTQVVTMLPVAINGQFFSLFPYLKVANTTGQFRIAGSLSSAAAGIGALVAVLKGVPA